MKYRRKSVVVDVVQWTWENINEIRNFAKNSCQIQEIRELGMHLCWVVRILTSDGIKRAMIGDCIIKDSQGELYLCASDIFERNYELI